MHRIEKPVAVVALVCLAVVTSSCIDILKPNPVPPVPAATPRDTTPVPDTSILRVTVSTSGEDPDSDGYALELSPAVGATPVILPRRGSVDIRVPVGAYSVRLLGVAGNCAAYSPQWQWGGGGVVSVPRSAAGQPAVQLSFDVSCDWIPTTRLAPGTQLAFVRNGRIWRVNSDGSDPVQLTTGPVDSDPAWSPDGRRIAFARSKERDAWGTPIGYQIFIMDADGSNLVQLTTGTYDRAPAWSPDGLRVAFTSLCPEGEAMDGVAVHECVLVASADPADVRRTRIGWPKGVNEWPAWSPDGTRIAFSSDWVAFDYPRDLYLATVGSSAIVRITSSFPNGDFGPYYEEFYQSAWSPDGRQLAVVHCLPQLIYCDASDLTLMNPDGSGMRSLVRTRGFTRPTWSPDGRTIAFGSGGSIQWVSADGSARGLIVADGESPAWHP